jgi:hypothetical protein
MRLDALVVVARLFARLFERLRTARREIVEVQRGLP